MTIYDRRSILKATGAATAVGVLAGCAGAGDDPADDESEDDPDDEPDDDEPDDEDEPDEEPDGESGLRVAHLSPDASNVDVFVDGDAVLEDAPFRTVSGYLDLEPGARAVEITEAGDSDAVVFDEEVEVEDGDATAAAIGELSEENESFDLALFEDDLSDPGDDSRLRLVHASPDAPDVHVTVDDGEAVLVEDLSFGEAATAELEPDTYAIEIRSADDEDADEGSGAIDDEDDEDEEVEFPDPVATFDVTLQEGTIYSAFAVGYLAPGEAPAEESFDLEIVTDTHEEAERVEAPEPPAFRAANMSPDAPELDVHMDGDIVLEGVPFREVTEYLEFEQETTNDVGITEAGTTDEVFFEETLQFSPEYSSTLVALGEVEGTYQSFQVGQFIDDFSTQEDTARVRVIHASPDATVIDVTLGETGSSLFSGVEYGAQQTRPLSPGTHTLEVREADPDGEGPVIETVQITVEVGGVYTAFAGGYVESESAPVDEPFDVEFVTDGFVEPGEDEEDEPDEEETEPEEDEDEDGDPVDDDEDEDGAVDDDEDGDGAIDDDEDGEDDDGSSGDE